MLGHVNGTTHGHEIWAVNGREYFPIVKLVDRRHHTPGVASLSLN